MQKTVSKSRLKRSAKFFSRFRSSKGPNYKVHHFKEQDWENLYFNLVYAESQYLFGPQASKDKEFRVYIKAEIEGLKDKIHYKLKMIRQKRNKKNLK